VYKSNGLAFSEFLKGRGHLIALEIDISGFVLKDLLPPCSSAHPTNWIVAKYSWDVETRFLDCAYLQAGIFA
jgi:hypothetical protein